MDKLTVYAAAYSNFAPDEVDSLWDCQACAEKRVEELGGDMWEVHPMTVKTMDVIHSQEATPEPHQKQIP